MEQLLKRIAPLPAYRDLREAVGSGHLPRLVTGIAAIHKAFFISALCADTGMTAHILVPNEPAGLRLCEDINTFLGNDSALLYPVRELSFRAVESASHEYEHARLGVLHRILTGSCKIVISTPEAAAQFTLPPSVFQQNVRRLASGDSGNLSALCAHLVQAGYTRAEQVEGISQFAVRGGILDFFPPGAPAPYRVEFWGDEIDTISLFDVATQRRREDVKNAAIPPAREALPGNLAGLEKQIRALGTALRGKYGVLAKAQIDGDLERLQKDGTLPAFDKYLPVLYDVPATLYDYCEDRLLFACEPMSLRENLQSALSQHYEDVKLLMSQGVLFKGCDTFFADFPELLAHLSGPKTLLLDHFTRTIPEVKLQGLDHFNLLQLSAWSGDYALLKADLEDYTARGYSGVVLAGTEKACEALCGDLQRDGIRAELRPDISRIPPKTVAIVPGALSAGFELPELALVVLTHTKALLPARKKKLARHKAGKRIRELSDLHAGDYVVHAGHGIGVFEGILQRDIHGVIKDYIKIRYAGTDVLFVPVTQLDLVSKYIGASEGATVRLNKLNSAEWQKTRARVKSAVKDMAKDLIKLYAERMNTPGYEFSPDSDWQREFEQRFPYEETDDQLRCVQEIKQDMQRTVPMDRLLCGDVGFGKTEVALRAVFKCVLDGKQCAVLVPTTILAWQHYQTFTHRLEGYPVTVELLSRYRSAKEQKDVIARLRKGQVDIVIGTHRAVQKDVAFKDLGLCVIDEEQRFGVAHKENFKKMCANVDVLTLSATPIPRTLNMAMSGIRDMSVIEEAPQDRVPVQTYVLEHDMGIVQQALQKELRRGGQVFYLHNRVDSIDSCAMRLQEQLPEARIMVAHGKMGEDALNSVWQHLLEHEIDILVCTTIIETGVDVPNCNTLVIEDADRMGLSQLYQLRGRVGRSARRAYAYFTFRPGKALSEVAAKRLQAIREFTAFGSGFRIAMRDMEIRGAGNILGAQQHGHMAAVGYDLYLRLLAEAVSEESGQDIIPRPTECIIDVRLPAHIPEHYIWNQAQRIDIYKKIATVADEEDVLDITDELIDRFGDPPPAVTGLIDVALIRNSAASLGITEITQSERKIILYAEKIDPVQASHLATAMAGRVTLKADPKPTYLVTILKGQNPISAIQETLGHLKAAR